MLFCWIFLFRSYVTQICSVVEYWITVPKEGGSSPPGVFGDAAAEFAEFDLE